MLRSLAFTTQGRLHSRDIEMFLMPTVLADTNLFLWVDLEKPTPKESKFILEDLFHFHPLSIEDCLAVSPSPKAGPPKARQIRPTKMPKAPRRSVLESRCEIILVIDNGQLLC